jgi:hypothetical protein
MQLYRIKEAAAARQINGGKEDKIAEMGQVIGGSERFGTGNL